ncbi:MAG: hypothetical protein HQ472_07240 [Ignavibacteria bacterium]|nr:hypothetical protein [Ignavibacteria bacterium]
MRFSTFLKGGLLLAAFFIISSEAFAQLPVRTRTLQLLGSTSGAVTQDAPAVVTPYTVSWPASATGFLADADKGYLLGTRTAANDIDMTWVQLSGDLVDGAGAAGQVAYWTDANTLAGDAGFTYTAGGTVTVGEAGNNGVVVFHDAGLAADDFTTTLGNGTQTTNNTFNFDAPTVGGTYTVPVSTNGAGAGTTNFIFVSNGNGTGTWVTNPTAGLKSGIVTPANGAFSAAIVFGTAFALTPSVTVTASGPVANGYILQVTAITFNGCTVLSSAPFDGTDVINWVANAQYNP